MIAAAVSPTAMRASTRTSSDPATAHKSELTGKERGDRDDPEMAVTIADESV